MSVKNASTDVFQSLQVTNASKAVCFRNASMDVSVIIQHEMSLKGMQPKTCFKESINNP
jgi:hypothetical protein